MPKKNKTQKKSLTKKSKQTDSAYFLKLVMYLIISSFWLRVTSGDSMLPLPLGGLIAVIFALHDHFQIDRKIELALILIGMFVSFWLPIGIFVSL